MSVEQAFNFCRVNERIATAGIPTREQLAQLGSAGVEAVINLLPDSSEYAIEGEREIVEKQGLAYSHIPVNFAAPTEADFASFRRLMQENQGKSLFIHCAANYRVSAFYARFAVETGQWSQDQASEFISSIWSPADFPPWPTFLEG